MMGKLVQVVGTGNGSGRNGSRRGIALYGLSAATALACLLFPLISSRFIEPYIYAVYGQSASLGEGNVIIMTIMMAMSCCSRSVS